MTIANIRFSDEKLHERLKQEAKRVERSLNGEIIHRLRESLKIQRGRAEMDEQTA